MWDEDNESAYEEYIAHMEAVYEAQREAEMLRLHQDMVAFYKVFKIKKEKTIVIGGE